MASEGNLLEMGKPPLLNISAFDDDGFLQKGNFKMNNAILAEEQHLPMYDELASKHNVEYIAGGATQNTTRAAQWMLQIPGVGCIGKNRVGKEMKKNVKAAGVNAHYYEDETAPMATCAVRVVGGERSFITNLSSANCSKSDHPKRSKNWKLGLFDATRSSGKNTLRQLPSKIELPRQDESMKRFLTRSRAFHESPVVSESVKEAYLNRPLSPHLPFKKPQLSATYSISHRIIGVGVTTAVLLFPFVMKFSTLFDI